MLRTSRFSLKGCKRFVQSHRRLLLFLSLLLVGFLIGCRESNVITEWETLRFLWDRAIRYWTASFLIGMVFRPLPYEASVFQIEDWYTRGDEALKKQLFDFVVNAIRFIGCDEIWVADHEGKAPDLGMRWKEKNTFHLRRYVKN